MLKTMLWQGALAAALIGAAAAGYAQVRDTGYLSAPTASTPAGSTPAGLTKPDKAARGDHKDKEAGERDHARRAGREDRHHD